MRGTIYKLLSMVVLLVLLGTVSCTSNDLDSSGSADVILQVLSFDAPFVTAQRQTSTSGTCSVGGTLCQANSDCAVNETCVRTDVCILEVEDWTVTFQAAPKNDLAIPPFNDIIMTDVTISYAWVDPSIVTPPFVVGLGNVTIPAQGSNSVIFPPISSDAINNNPAIEGATATLTLTFRGQTVEGTQITQTALRQLVVEICDAELESEVESDSIASPGGGHVVRGFVFSVSGAAVEILTMTHARIRARQGDVAGAAPRPDGNPGAIAG